MTSQIAICNRALTKLGADRIIDLGDNNKQARALTAIYDSVLDSELTKYVWGFATSRTSLPALVTPPAYGYAHQYQLPADFLRVIMVGQYYVVADLTDYRGGPNTLYSIEGQAILTDLPAPLPLRYLRRVTDPTLYAAPFAEALASRLAAELAEDLTQSNSKRQLAQQEYIAAIREARRLGAIERVPEHLPDSEWIMCRL